jgi:hypothetical protein
MFLAPRSMPWLEAIEKIIDIMTSRISRNRMKYVDKNPDNVVAAVWQRIRDERDASAGFDVYELASGGGQYKVTPQTQEMSSGDHATHLTRIVERWCTCGFWQDIGIPCRHFMACFRKLKDSMEFRSLLTESHDGIPDFYKYKALQLLYEPNIVPVVVDTIGYDGKTKPRPPRIKRQPGRPKVKRYRRRSELSDPSKSPIVCSKCRERGHNRRTCGMKPKVVLTEVADNKQEE